MDTIKVNKKQTKMIAHRGVSKIETENTNAAFVAAGNRSYYGIETDVHKTADGRFVVIHNDTTGDCGNIDISVENSTYDELCRVILKDTDGVFGRIDLRIPELWEYISICKKYGKKAVLELKNHFERNDIAKVIEIIDDADYLSDTIFISFDLENLIGIRELLPYQTAQYLCGEWSSEICDSLIKYRLDIDIGYNALTKELIDKLHAAGIEVNCWTCDDKATAEALAEYGVDYITSNILE